MQSLHFSGGIFRSFTWPLPDLAVLSRRGWVFHCVWELYRAAVTVVFMSLIHNLSAIVCIRWRLRDGNISRSENNGFEDHIDPLSYLVCNFKVLQGLKGPRESLNYLTMHVLVCVRKYKGEHSKSTQNGCVSTEDNTVKPNDAAVL